jgi:hypothetical protein
MITIKIYTVILNGIPSIDNPQFIPVDEVDYLASNNLVPGFKKGSEIRAYPHPILNWHEIVNDKVGDKNLAVTYCPLTETGIGWKREIEESGILYR